MTGWLKNGVIALAIAGIYSIILVVLRTPQLSVFFTDQSMFKSALVIHVNLSVLVWLLAITGFVWSILKNRSGFESLFLKLVLLSMLLMAISPFISETVPIMNNYVPMLENIIFIIGLNLFGSIMLCFSLQTIYFSLLNNNTQNYGARIVRMVQFTSACMFLGVWICFTLSFIGVDKLSNIVPLDIDYYYEMLFWSGGHLLQFIYTQIMMLALLMLTETRKGGRVIYANIYEMLFALNFILSLFIFFGHINFEVADGEFKEFFTKHMIYAGGIAPTIFVILLIVEIIQNRAKNIPSFVSAAFNAASFLFLSGGFIGAIISGVNVTIPAHYHGSTVGISISFMGLSYLICFKKQILPHILSDEGVIKYVYNHIHDSFNSFASTAPFYQIYVMLFGQLLHITGLALAGGYGVLRKTPGSEIPISAKIYMGMVGLGGLIAIIGGLMFVYICVKNLLFLRHNQD